MHILLIHQTFAALDESGSARHQELVRHLARHGHRVTIIASPVRYLSGTDSGARVRVHTADLGVTILRSFTLPGLHHSSVGRVFSVISFMISSFINGLFVRRVDLVWGTTPPILQGLTAWLLASLKRVPFLLDVRDLGPGFTGAVGARKNKLLVRLSGGLARFLYRRADQVVVNSPGFIPHVTERGAVHVAFVPSGVDFEIFDPESDGLKFRRKFGLEGCFVVLYAGAVEPSNHLGVLLDAAELLRDQPDIWIILLGSGTEKQRLRSEADQRQLDHVMFLPPEPELEMPEVLAAADACLAISQPIEMYQTTYPNQVFDYMAAGRPVILAMDGVIRQMVEEAQAGVFVPPGDSQALASTIHELATDKKKCRTMGINGRKMIQSRYSREEVANQFAAILEMMRSRKDG